MELKKLRERNWTDNGGHRLRYESIWAVEAMAMDIALKISIHYGPSTGNATSSTFHNGWQLVSNLEYDSLSIYDYQWAEVRQNPLDFFKRDEIFLLDEAGAVLDLDSTI